MKINRRIKRLVWRALREDIRKGDITTESIFPQSFLAEAEIIAQEEGVIAGVELAGYTFQAFDKEISFQILTPDGTKVFPDTVILKIKGKITSLLSVERTALNFLSHLSGIATLTQKYVKLAQPYGVKIFDTRKTLPTLREIEKYAVRVGGGENHRFGLYDMVLIKDNHIKAEGSISGAIKKVKQNLKRKVKIEVEVNTLAQVKEALLEKPDIIMLDNMSTSQIQEAVKIINKKALIEVSGGITLEKIKEIAPLGIDRISIGALTHSAKALNLSMRII
jgi:nicotinate-nucleotide pyrophosphorylase (carboxylating)